jgi:hypothetical protein
MEALTVNKAKEIMKARGYTDVSHTQSGDVITSVNFIKYLNDEIRVHANVVLKSEDVTLSFVELKHFCELKCGRFALDHKDFEKFEQIMMIYAAKCLDVDVFQVLALLPLKVEGVTAEVKKDKKDVKTRKREFWDEVVAIGKKRSYPKDSCLKFYEYWTQMNTGGVKMQFEIMKAKKGVFDVGGRLVTWMKNDKEWANEKKSFVDKKVDKQNQETQVSQTINKEDVF